MRTRFAPSPTGPLHLGHAYSAILAHDMARAADGTFLLRIEDIDQGRARREWEDLIFEDLCWLGLSWETPVLRQSERARAYEAALDRLWNMGLLYPCICNRRDILAAASAPQEGAPLHGPDGIVYPGTCRPPTTPSGARPTGVTLRLDMARALNALEMCNQDVTNPVQQDCTCLTFNELAYLGHSRSEDISSPCGPSEHDDLSSISNGTRPQRIEATIGTMLHSVGDVVLARRDMGTSYHLSVVVDDAAQNISHVIRGEDLFDATPIHVLLQKLLDLPTPEYVHHRLIRDEVGKRLAKRDDAHALQLFRDAGETPEQIRARIGLLPDAN